MIINCQNRSCHPERSEGSAQRETLRCAQGDNTLPILVVKIHYRGTRACPRQDPSLILQKPPLYCCPIEERARTGLAGQIEGSQKTHLASD